MSEKLDDAQWFTLLMLLGMFSLIIYITYSHITDPFWNPPLTILFGFSCFIIGYVIIAMIKEISSWYKK